MPRRGSYFFVLDAIIGGVIIIASLTIVLGSYTNTADNRGQLTLVQDMLAYLQNTEVRDFEGNYTQELLDDGNISDPERSLFEQVAAFHAQDNFTVGERFLGEIVNSTLPEQYSLRYRYNDTVMYNRSTVDERRAATSLTIHRVSVLRQNLTSIYGPHPVEVSIWIP